MSRELRLGQHMGVLTIAPGRTLTLWLCTWSPVSRELGVGQHMGVLTIAPGRTLTLSEPVADPGCLSPILDPDFYPYRIPDPKTATKRGEKKLLSYLVL